MSSAMKQLEGVVTDADAYKQLLASLGMGLDDDSDLCSEDDEEEEGEEEEETQLFAKSSAAEVETGTNPGLWQVVGGAKPIAGEAAATADVDFGAADVWGQAPSALQAPSPTSLHSATSQLSSPSPHASNSTPKLLYGSDAGQVPAAAAPLQPQGLPAAKRVVLSGADFQLVSQVEDW
ncbi:hypothetical protein QJQ45_003661 [Haematococcus lacustris]|nr:hypothetical protein QJQ45_003661 [Haematococcus lacustris]